MLKSLEQLQTGLVSPKSFESAVITNRIFDLNLSRRTIIRSCYNSGITALDIDKVEDRYLLSGAKNGDLAIHDLLNSSGHPSYTAEVVSSVRRNSTHAHKFTVKTVQWFPFDTGLFVTSSMDQKLKIWNANTLKPADTITFDHPILGHHMSAASSQSLLIAVAMSYPNINLIDPKTGSRSHELRAHKSGVVSVRWSPTSEHLLASGGMDNKIFYWDVRSAKGPLQSLDQHNGEAIGSQKDLISAHNGHINSLRFTDDGLFMLSHGTDSHMRLWDVALNKNTLVNYGFVPSPNPYLPVSIDICCDSSPPIAFVPSNFDIIMYDLFKGWKSRVLSGHFNSVTTCVYRATTQELYCAGNDMNILMFTPDVEKEEAYSSSLFHENFVSESDSWSSDE